MKEKIKLQSRYRDDNNYLTRIAEFGYRVGIVEGDPDTYSFVDPSGGPFMQKGTVIDGCIIKSISREGKDAIINFES